MTSLTIALPDETMIKLREIAERYQVTPEELVQARVEELVTSSEESFQDAVTYALEKNQALYKRLAA